MNKVLNFLFSSPLSELSRIKFFTLLEAEVSLPKYRPCVEIIYQTENKVNSIFQSDMTMSSSVAPNAFHSTCCTTTAHFMVEGGFREREDTVIFIEL